MSKSDFPKIFFSKQQEDKPFFQNNCDVVVVALDGSVNSNLNWSKSEELAQVYIKNGKKILWDFKLGLFESLSESLSDAQQFLSLELAIAQFNKMIQEKYLENTFGVIFYKGKDDFPYFLHNDEDFNEWLSQHKLGDDKKFYPIFRRDVYLDYIKLLTSKVIEEIDVFLLISSDETVPSKFFQMVSNEAYEHLKLVISNPLINDFPDSIKALGWNQHSPFGYLTSESEFEKMPNQISKVGLCLHPFFASSQADLIINQVKQFTSLKIILEGSLNQDWDGLDYLIVFPQYLSVQGKRKILGFCAAGGTIISIGSPIGLHQDQEISYDQFLEKFNVPACAH